MICLLNPLFGKVNQLVTRTSLIAKAFPPKAFAFSVWECGSISTLALTESADNLRKQLLNRSTISEKILATEQYIS